ncbi:DUF4190 domain-containing protein [Streptomyces sp. NBC_01092]|uniref:DUF4190 domain-containing protein n=1 Tax=Streptomyces sp. NBC_01092 TaxID=2903748 RepID=UPI00386DF38A|nr:DUF4190 domain-containing protein [Streptomyces sp. NBC_01092]
MSDDAQTPEAPEVSGEAAAGGFVSPGGAGGATGATSLDKTSGDGRGGTPQAAGPDSVDPWAAGPGPGHTVASNEPPAWAAPSVHDQRTVTSMPSAGQFAEPPGPPNPFAAPGPTHADPFAAPGPMHADPFAAPYAAHGEPVPPPPMSPDGPGQVPYGYPAPGPGYYGWPGMQPMPSNGMGTAGLVLGIISAAIFCLWPLAIILGVLALIFGAIGRAKARRGEATNPGQALAGMICGAAGTVLGFGMLALVIATGV